MNVFISFIQNNIDKLFVGLLCVAAIVYLYYVYFEVFTSTEFKVRLQIKRAIKSFCGLMRSLRRSEPIKSKSFLNHIVNNGDDPDELTEKIVIDDCYLSENSSVYMKKR